MTLADMKALDVAALWDGLSWDLKMEIGTAAIEQELARLVSEDDGTDTDIDDRQAALEMASTASIELANAVEAALPDIRWWNE